MRVKYTYLLFGLLLLAISCQEDSLNSEAEFYSYHIPGQEGLFIDLDPVDRTINLLFPETVTSASDLVAEYEVSDGALVTVKNEVQISGTTGNDFERPFTYTVTSEDRSRIHEWAVASSNNEFTNPWGLGGFQKKTLSNNRDYSWYLDQANTGEHSRNNCGPTSTTMAALWFDEHFDRTAEQARESYNPEGGWWYTDDIHDYLNDFNIPHFFISLGSYSDATWSIVTSQLDAGNICILNLDMYYVRGAERANWRVDKFYNTNGRDWGHFIIAKGYKVVDGNKYFEIYDPYSWEKKYSDGGLKGMDRHYRSEDIFKATSIWWNHTIVISPKGTKSMPREALEASSIEHQWGG